MPLPKAWDIEEREGRVYPRVAGIILVYLAKDHGMLDYADPDDERNCPIKAFAEPLDNDVLNDLHVKYARINEAVTAREMPQRVDWPGGKAFPCAYC